MLKWIAVAALVALPSQVVAFEDWGGFYAEIYGGGVAGGDVSVVNESPVPTTTGSAFGAAVGVNAPMPGVAFELDVMYTSAELVGGPGMMFDTVSTMANVEYAVPLGDTFEAYGALGLGAVYMHNYDIQNGDTTDGWGAGYQASLGGRVAVSDNLALFGELKYVDAFSPVYFQSIDTSVSRPTLSALGGIRLSLD